MRDCVGINQVRAYYVTMCNYSVPHEESKRMLGMCDVTSIAVIQ